MFYSDVERRRARASRQGPTTGRTQTVQHFIATYGYAAIFLLMLAESACIPIPSELIMTFGGALAAGAVAGTHLNIIVVIIAGVAGNVVGSYVAWGVGKYGGQAALRRWGRRIRVREHGLEHANAWFERHGPWAVLIGRCLPSCGPSSRCPPGSRAWTRCGSGSTRRSAASPGPPRSPTRATPSAATGTRSSPASRAPPTSSPP